MLKLDYMLKYEEQDFNVSMLTDEALEQLMERYKEKLQRYTVFLNEEKERTERKILIVHLEQVKRFHLRNRETNESK